MPSYSNFRRLQNFCNFSLRIYPLNITKFRNFNIFNKISFVCTKVVFRICLPCYARTHTHIHTCKCFVIRDTIANTCDKVYIRSMSHPTSILESVRFSSFHERLLERTILHGHVTQPTRRIRTNYNL